MGGIHHPCAAKSSCVDACSSADSPRPGSVDLLLRDLVEACVEARVADLARPELVHQRSVERVVGLPARRYLALARSGAFPSSKDQRLVYARTTEVVAYVEAQAPQPATSANDGANDLDAALARVGARQVGGAR